MFDHAMDCISWLANEITENRDHIDDEDLWYKTGNAANQCIIENKSGLQFFDVDAVARVTIDDLKANANNRSEMVQSTNAINDSFNVEVKRQRLATKRKNHKIGSTITRITSQTDEIEEPPQQKQQECTLNSDSAHTPIGANQSLSHTLVVRRRHSRRTRTTTERVSPFTGVLRSPSRENESDRGEEKEQEDAIMSQPCNSPTWEFVEEQVTKSLEAERQQCTNSPSTSPPVACNTWVLNDRKYFRMIVHLWEWQFKVEKLSRVHIASIEVERPL